MKIISTKIFLNIIILLSLFFLFNNHMLKKKKLLKNLEENEGVEGEGEGEEGEGEGGEGEGGEGEGGEETHKEQTPAGDSSVKTDEEILQNKCEAQRPYESSDCFDIEFEYGDDYMSKCCFLEYKDKENNNKKMRECFIVSYNQFLDIKKTIKDLKNKDEFKNRTSLSLECDKSSFLFLRKIFILITLIIL